jgi:uncharacterized oxidoreductase
MVPRYVAVVLEGGLRPNTAAELIADRGAVLSFDGGSGYGQVVAAQAMAAGIARARDHGVVVVGLANAHHLGRVGAWAEQCAAAGLVSLHFANVCSMPIVVPWNGTVPKMGTNPICIGWPRRAAEPLILDFATSAIAVGKARVAHNMGQVLAPGLAVDDRGRPTTDPRVLVEPPFGGLLPFGLHKGAGLALVCSLLGAALTGAPTEREADPSTRRVLNGMLSILLDPAALGGAATHEDEAERFLAWVRDGQPGDGSFEFPGDPERRHEARRARDGISVDDVTWAELQAARAALVGRGRR